MLHDIIDPTKGKAMPNTDKERISSRVPKPVRKTLEEAAALSGATLNQFIVQAALKEAHAVLERERIIRLSRRDAQAFFRALENPPSPKCQAEESGCHLQALGLECSGLSSWDVRAGSEAPVC
jgi:uncharacterized protein (DUF1778 family)